MKTVADLKRYLIEGAKIKLTWSRYMPHKNIGLERHVKKTQTNGVYFFNPEKPESFGCWLDFPKASDFLGTKTGWIILEKGEKLLEYEIIKGVQTK